MLNLAAFCVAEKSLVTYNTEGDLLPLQFIFTLKILSSASLLNYISSVQYSSVAQSCLTLCDPMNCSTPGLPVHHQLLESTQTHVHCVSDAIQPSTVIPFSSCPQSFSASGFFQMSQLFTSGPKYWSFSIKISPSNEYSGLISFRMDWLDLLAVQGTLKSLLQHHSSKASILWCSAFFMVQLSHPYVTTG